MYLYNTYFKKIKGFKYTNNINHIQKSKKRTILVRYLLDWAKKKRIYFFEGYCEIIIHKDNDASAKEVTKL